MISSHTARTGRCIAAFAVIFLAIPMLLCSADAASAAPAVSPVKQGTSGRRAGPVRLSGRCLVDDGGPFLGLGASYFTAVWDCRNDRMRLGRELGTLARSGFNYIRVFSMVGWYPFWAGREIPPNDFTTENGVKVKAWPDYWQQMAGLVDAAYDGYGLRTQITIFADAQLMPDKKDRVAHLRNILSRVVAGREHKLMLLEVANEGWQNGFPGEQGQAEMREYAAFLAERSGVPVAVTSNHIDSLEQVYRGSAADIATWHFSRDIGVDDGWAPVYDPWSMGDVPGLPPVSSNEPIGPGSSVNTENEPIRLVMAAAFAYTAKLPMYVYHSSVGVKGMGHYEGLPGIDAYRRLLRILPGELPNWDRNDGKEPRAPFTAYAGGLPERYWPEVPVAQDGCVRNIGARSGDAFVCVPVGIREKGLRLQAREALHFTVYNPLTGADVLRTTLKSGETFTLPKGPGAYIIKGSVLKAPPRSR